MNLRPIIPSLGWMLAILVSAAFAGTACLSLAGERPSVVLMVADDLGWGDLGCYGHPDIKTPNIDALAARGIRFTDFTVAASTCSPSRAAILSGRFSSRTGVHMYISAASTDLGNAPFLPPGMARLADAFRAGGYRTALFGKWHLGGGGYPWEREGDPPAPSVDAYGYDDHAITPSGSGKQLDIPEDVDGAFPFHFVSELVVDEAIDFVAESPGPPFFLHLNFHAPHSVLAPPAALRQRDYPEFAAFGKRADTYAREYGLDGYTTPQEVYYTAVTELDRQIGRLIDFLDERELRRDTILIFLSDNGAEIGNSPMVRHSNAGSNGPFRAGKASLYEGGLRVPLIVSWPDGGVPEGLVNRRTVISGVDLLPTLAGWLELPLGDADALDGEDLHAAILGDPVQRAKPLFWENLEAPRGNRALNQSPALAIREGKWKLLCNHNGSRMELYHLATDPGERRNLAEFEPDRAARMKRAIDAIVDSTPLDRSRSSAAGRRDDPWLDFLRGNKAPAVGWRGYPVKGAND